MLHEIIRDTIIKKGPVSFKEFMQLALYHPSEGYYNTPSQKIGEQGDFYTSPAITSLFGESLARQLEEIWKTLGQQKFSIVEYGAGTGLLCRDIMNYLQKNEDMIENLRYYIVEQSPEMRKISTTIIPPQVIYINDISELEGITGCVISNELVDNFPVHQVIMEEELMEVFIDYKEGFAEVLRPASPALNEYLQELGIHLPQGFRTEINLEAINWLSNVSASIYKGFVITIDYGDLSGGLYHERRSQGTLLCYHKHQISHSPYINVGEQDITTHVNFSALMHWGEKSGLDCVGFTSQAKFLAGLGIGAYAIEKQLQLHSPQLVKAFLFEMGQKIKVLVQKKNVERPMLSGLQFA
jgi:SAM-dependent MidA family methyltransferase